VAARVERAQGRLELAASPDEECMAGDRELLAQEGTLAVGGGQERAFARAGDEGCRAVAAAAEPQTGVVPVAGVPGVGIGEQGAAGLGECQGAWSRAQAAGDGSVGKNPASAARQRVRYRCCSLSLS
jgi:hypothetical protein